MRKAEVIPGSDRRTVAQIMCYKCNKMGHYFNICPKNMEGEVMHINAYEVTTNNKSDTYDDVDGIIIG